jgi:hypothetical protein
MIPQENPFPEKEKAKILESRGEMGRKDSRVWTRGKAIDEKSESRGLLFTLGFWSVGSTFNGQTTHIQNAALWLCLNLVSSSPRFLGVLYTALVEKRHWIWYAYGLAGTFQGQSFEGSTQNVDTLTLRAVLQGRPCVAYNLQPKTARKGRFQT